MLKLLPHRFKKIGVVTAPTGFLIWIAMQIGWVADMSNLLGFKDATPLNMSAAIIGFMSFLFGVYAMTFSKEKIEDEMITNVRLKSFQSAAFVQIIFLIVGLISIGFVDKPPKDAGMMLFFISAIMVFWVVYIVRFNYILYVGIFKYEK